MIHFMYLEKSKKLLPTHIFEYLIIDDINLLASDGSSGKMDNQDIQKINIGIKYKS